MIDWDSPPSQKTNQTKTTKNDYHNQSCSQRKIGRKSVHGRKKSAQEIWLWLKTQQTLKESSRDFSGVANTVQEFEALTCC